MDTQAASGSLGLRIFFYLLPALLVAAAAAMVGRAAVNAGDPREAAAAMRRRFVAAALLWIAAVGAAGYAGVLARPGPPPAMLLVLAGILALAVGLARSAVGDRLARLPLAALVGFQSFRLPLELAMHRAYVEGLMPVQMSYSGLNFDIVSGATAAALAAALWRARVPLWIVTAWNWLGLALLVNIVTVAVLSMPLFAWFGPGALNVWVFSMPYAMLPAVMVLAALAGHLIVFRAISFRAASRPDPR